MKTLDYINVRDAQVHGLVNPTFIMHGNCSLKDYSFNIFFFLFYIFFIKFFIFY